MGTLETGLREELLVNVGLATLLGLLVNDGCGCILLLNFVKGLRFAGFELKWLVAETI